MSTYPGGRQSKQVDTVPEDLAGRVIPDSARQGEWIPHDAFLSYTPRITAEWSARHENNERDDEEYFVDFQLLVRSLAARENNLRGRNGSTQAAVGKFHPINPVQWWKALPSLLGILFSSRLLLSCLSPGFLLVISATSLDSGMLLWHLN